MQQHNYAFTAIGTEWEIESRSLIAQHIIQRIIANTEYFDKIYSRFRNDSLIASIAKNGGIYKFPENAGEIFSFYETLFDSTNGKVTPLIGDMLVEAGYDSHYSFIPSEIHDVARWPDVVSRKHGHILTVNRPVTIDIGAAGKGWLVDQTAEILETSAVNNYTIDASGDMRHSGSNPIMVGLEHPHDDSQIIGELSLHNASLCASATNRRVWGRGLHHIFDPDLKSPVSQVLATWVIAKSAMIADGLATALFFSEPAQLRSSFDFQYVRMHTNGTIDYSNNLRGRIY